MRSANSESNVISKILRNAVLILFLVVFISVVYNFVSNKESPTESALLADASASTEFRGVFVRDEQLVTYSGTGVISYNVADGGKVGTGSVIAQIYPTDEQIKVNREIERLTEELDILNKIQNPGTLESAQPAGLSEDIEETYRTLIYSRDTRDYETIDSEKNDLLVLLSTYQMVTDDSVDFTQKILDLTAELAELQSVTTKPAETIVSDRSAYFMSSTDGYEDKLTKNTVSSLTIEQIRGITNTKDTSPEIAGKLIDGYEWYLVGIIDNSRKEYVIGDTVYLRFESASETFRASVIDVRDEGDPSESIITVSCDHFNYDLVQNRCEDVELIKGDYTGLKVPREAIRFLPIEETVTDKETGITSTVITNYKGVYTLEGEQVEFKKLDVIYEGNDYVLSKVREDDSSYLALYDDILIEGDGSNG